MASNQQPAGHEQVTLLVDGIRCANCCLAIEKRLAMLPGMDDIAINPATRHATLGWDPRLQELQHIVAAIRELGFEPHTLSGQTRVTLNQEERRAALRRLIVAGLGMMQVMTYAVAIYAGAFEGMSIEFQRFFRLLSLLVSTPVVFYSAFPFFAAAVRDLSQRRVGMDVPVALAIGTAYCSSVVITFFGQPSTEVYFDSVVMFTFFLSLGRFAEMLARHHTVATGEALSILLPATARRLDANGNETVVALEEITPGDRLLLGPGDTIPVDGIVTWGTSATDESLLTGESQPRSREVGDSVIAGSINLSGPLQLEASHVGAETTLSGIARLLERAQSERPRLAQVADRVAGYFVSGVLLIAAAVAFAWIALDPSRAFGVTLSVLVVTCPCALSLATPTALTAATGALANSGLLTTRGTALEVLARATTLLFDKTGTLTYGRIVIRELVVLDDDTDSSQIHALAAALEAGSSHPLAVALQAPTSLHADSIEVFPGRGIEGRIDGNRYRIGRRDFVVALAGNGPEVPDVGDATVIYLGADHGLLAAFVLADTLRPEAQATIEALRDRGVAIGIVSGDGPAPVAAIARRLGIDEFRHSLLPDQKLVYLKQRRALGENVAMVGDGINDAPVLAGADVSIAMASGSMLAQASADLVLTGGLDRLVFAIDKARQTRRVIRQNLGWAVIYNLVALPLAAAGLVAPWMAAIGMSLSSLLVVLNAMRLSRKDPVAGGPEERLQIASGVTP